MLRNANPVSSYLPDAFVRRCLVLYLALPENDEELKRFLENRGHAHFPKRRDAVLNADDAVVRSAAEQLARDRRQAKDEKRLPLPGQAEYLDLLRAVLTLYPQSPDEQRKALATIARYTTQKHTGAG